MLQDVCKLLNILSRFLLSLSLQKDTHGVLVIIVGNGFGDSGSTLG